jgi:hypothetical protein
MHILGRDYNRHHKLERKNLNATLRSSDIVLVVERRQQTKNVTHSIPGSLGECAYSRYLVSDGRLQHLDNPHP